MEEIGVLLPKVLKPQLSRLEPPVIEVLAPLWTRVAGKALARQCRPVAFSAGTLTLAADDADWAEPLRQMAEEIRAHVNNFLGKPVVKHLRILPVRQFERSEALTRQPQNLPASHKHWPGQESATAAGIAQVVRRPHSKYSERKRGQVH